MNYTNTTIIKYDTNGILVTQLPNPKAKARLPNNTSLGYDSGLEKIIVCAKRDLNLTLQNVHHPSTRQCILWEFVKCYLCKVTRKVGSDRDTCNSINGQRTLRRTQGWVCSPSWSGVSGGCSRLHPKILATLTSGSFE
jgi:hypothetical protein